MFLLFTIVINSLSSSSLHGSLILYANDACITYSAPDVKTILSWITEDLFALNNWYTFNGLTINFDKTVYMLFSKQSITESLQPIVFNNILIRRVVTFKYLGLVLDEKLKWNEHITHIRARVLPGVRAILKLRRLVNTQHLLSIYYSLIHTHFTYMAGIWGSASKNKI